MCYSLKVGSSAIKAGNPERYKVRIPTAAFNGNDPGVGSIARKSGLLDLKAQAAHECLEIGWQIQITEICINFILVKVDSYHAGHFNEALFSEPKHTP